MRAKIFTAIALCLLLATTAGLIAFGLYHHEGRSYIGEISINDQNRYVTFLDAIFVPSVKVNVLDIQPIGTDIPTVHEELLAAYPSPAPIVIGFDLSAKQNPLEKLDGVRLYEQSFLPFKIVPMLAIAMIGYGTALGLWLGRKGFTEQ